MTLDEMKLAVASKLPELIHIHDHGNENGHLFLSYWKPFNSNHSYNSQIKWEHEGLQVCYHAKELFTHDEFDRFLRIKANDSPVNCPWKEIDNKPWQKILEYICHVWWPERFEK